MEKFQLFKPIFTPIEDLCFIKHKKHPCYALYNANNIDENDIAFLAEKFLHENEQNIIKRRKNIVAKKEYIASRFLIKSYISEHLAISYQTLQLSFDTESAQLKALYKGKPLALNISLTHSKGFIFFAITTDAINVAVDFEYQNTARDTQTLANAYFHPDEAKWLLERDQTQFYRLWTLKEALAKITASSVLEVLKQNTKQQLAQYHHTTGQYKEFTFAVIQSMPFINQYWYLINHEKALQLSHE